jgi:hypothetical protein
VPAIITPERPNTSDARALIAEIEAHFEPFYLADYARSQGVGILRRETGIHKHAAIGLYEQMGFPGVEMTSTCPNHRARSVLWLLTIAWVITGCGSATPTPAPLAPEIVDEYAVYSALIQTRYVETSGVELIVLQEQTTIEWVNDDALSYLEQELAGVTPELLQDFADQNQGTRGLERAFNLSVDYVFISLAEQQELFSTDAGWSEFYDKYPASSGILYLSRVGFSAQPDQALVYVGHQSDYLLGVGFYYLLTHRDGAWTIVDEVFAWVS